MEPHYQKKTYKLFGVWLTAFAVVLIAGAVYTPNIAGLGTIKSISILLYGMLDLLFVLIYLTQSIYWVAGVSFEEASEAGAKARRRFALRHLLLFLGATAVYFVYCFAAAPRWRLGAYWDSIIAGAVVCAAALLGDRLQL